MWFGYIPEPFYPPIAPWLSARTHPIQHSSAALRHQVLHLALTMAASKFFLHVATAPLSLFPLIYWLSIGLSSHSLHIGE